MSIVETQEDTPDTPKRNWKTPLILGCVGIAIVAAGASFEVLTEKPAPLQSIVRQRLKEGKAAPEVETIDGPRRVSPHGHVAPTEVASTSTEQVDYFNPNTGTSSTYELEVDRDTEGNIERINFPNEGWLEIDGQTTDNGDGTETYTNEHGAQYTIHQGDDGQDSANVDSDQAPSSEDEEHDRDSGVI